MISASISRSLTMLAARYRRRRRRARNAIATSTINPGGQRFGPVFRKEEEDCGSISCMDRAHSSRHEKYLPPPQFFLLLPQTTILCISRILKCGGFSPAISLANLHFRQGFLSRKVTKGRRSAETPFRNRLFVLLMHLHIQFSADNACL